MYKPKIVAEINLDKKGNMSEYTYYAKSEAQGIKFHLYDKLKKGKLLKSYNSYNTCLYEICKFDGYGKILLMNKTPLVFRKSLVAQFFTSEEHLKLHTSQFDIDILKSNKKELLTYKDVYDIAYGRMKYYETTSQLTDEIKEKVISGFLKMMIKFVDKRNVVKKFVDEFQKKNKEYKYVRIFQPNWIDSMEQFKLVLKEASNPDIRYAGEIETLIKQGVIELNFNASTPQDADKRGILAKKPLYIQNLCVSESMRLKGIGKKVLTYVEDFATKNGYDIIYGYVAENASFSKDSRQTHFCDVDMVKNWLFRKGYAINDLTNEFHKVIKLDGVQESNKPINTKKIKI